MKRHPLGRGLGFEGCTLSLFFPCVVSGCLLAASSLALAREPRCNAIDNIDTRGITQKVDLVELAERTGCDPTEPEKKLLRRVHDGRVADYSDKSLDQNDPSKADSWSASREIGADLIRWLCVNPQASRLVDPSGIEIMGARIAGDLNLLAVTVPFPLLIVKSSMKGELSARLADFKMLILDGSWIGPIQAHGAIVRGSAFLRDGFHSEGVIRFSRATIGESLEMSGATLHNPSGLALWADGINVAGDLFMSDWVGSDGTKSEFTADGKVSLIGATIGEDLDCSHGTFRGELDLSSATIGRRALLDDGFSSEARLSLVGTKVGNSLSLEGASLTEVIAEDANIGGKLIWTKIRKSLPANSKPIALGDPPAVQLDLVDATTGTLMDDSASWPAQGMLQLGGFKYSHIVGPNDPYARIEWLRRQSTFTPEPYEELAGVLAAAGDDAGSREVLIAMNDDLSLRETSPWVVTWRVVLKNTVAYGYKPWYVVPWAAVFLFFGYVSFRVGYWLKVIRPTEKEDLC